MKGQGRVLAFEPSPVFDVLAKTARLYPTITPRRAGIGSQNSSLTFYAQGHATIGSFVRDVTAMTGQVAITEHRVPVNPLDEALEGLYPDLVKVDVEGFELEVLRGASKTIKSGCDWLIEIHPYQLRLSGGSEREVRRVLSDYTIETIGERGNGIYTIVATPKRC
jgi:FkbM family methyltransferase